MPVPSTYRWVSVGGLTVEAVGDRPEEHDPFTIDDVIAAVEAELPMPRGRRVFRNNRMRMWASNLGRQFDQHFYVLLLHAADKDAVPSIFMDFDTEEPRYEQKLEGEGAWFSGHLLIKKQPDAQRRYEVFVEKLPHISFTNIAAHLNWVLRQHGREYQTDTGPKSYYGHVKIAGAPSTNLANALATGKLLDIQLVERQLAAGGLDEVRQFKDVVSKTTFKVGNAVLPQSARDMLASVLGKAKRRLRDEDGVLPELLLRLETAGQERTSSLEYDPEALEDADEEDLEEMAAELLRGALVLNERISGFEEPLQQAHAELSREVVRKILDQRAARNRVG